MPKKSIRFVDIKKKLNKEKLDRLNRGTAKKLTCQVSKGMHDIIFDERKIFDRVISEINSIGSFYGYEKIISPIIEYGDLFSHGLGKDSSILNDLFTIKGSADKNLVLRPEGVIPSVRAYLEHNLAAFSQPVKIFYLGQYFQDLEIGNKEFYQAGFEIIGDDNSINDIEMIFLSKTILTNLGIQNLSIELNSVGCPKCVKNYEKALEKYYKEKGKKLCSACKSNLKSNPLALFACEEERCRALRVDIPKITDFICVDCKNHLQTIQRYLKDMKMSAVINPEVFLNTNYYTRTIWRISAEIDNENKDKVIIAWGGRQDDLIRLFSGQNKPLSGFVLDIDKLVSFLKSQRILDIKHKLPMFFLMPVGETAKRKSFEILEELRKNDIKVSFSFGKDSVRSQMKAAGKIKTKYILLLGQEEVGREEIILQETSSDLQENVSMNKLVKVLKNKIEKLNTLN